MKTSLSFDKNNLFVVQMPNGELHELVGGYEKDVKSKNSTIFFSNLIFYLRGCSGLSDTKQIKILQEDEKDLFEFLLLDIEDDALVCNLTQAQKIDMSLSSPFVADLYRQLFPDNDGVLVVYNYHQGIGLYSSFDHNYPNKILITFDPNSYPHYNPQ